MVPSFIRIVLVLLLACAPLSAADAVEKGMTRREVEEALGAPASELNKANHQILIYPGGTRVEIVGGLVASVAHAATQPQAAAAASEGGNSDVPAAAIAPRTKAAVPDSRPATIPWWKHDPLDNPLFDENPWLVLIANLLLGSLIVMIVLRIIFYIREWHATWWQMFILALAGAGTEVALVAGSVALWQRDVLFPAQHGTAGLVLMGMLWRTSQACTLQRAFLVAGIATIAKGILWSGLLVTLVLFFIT